VPGAAAARRYANALFQLAEEGGQVDEIRAQLDALAALLERSPELAQVLMQPLYPVKERRAVMNAVAERLAAGPLLRQFWAYLIDRRRLVQFEAIRGEYGRLADERAGVVRARVRAASELTGAQRERLERALEARVGRRVALDVTVEPELLGGLVAQVGDLMFDGSLRTQLRQLGASLARE